MIKITLGEIAKAVGGELNKKEQSKLEVENIAIDSRIEVKGGLFIALKGEKVDGHKFIKSAEEKGCICALVNRGEYKDNVVIEVDDTRKGIMDLAKYYRSKLNIKVIGITGSSGKTTTKDIVSSVLEQKYKVLKTEGNFNNELGVPLTVFRIEDDDEIAVIEMGMNKFGEIHNLTKIAKPDISIITNIGNAHIENLGNKEGVLDAKLEITNGMENGSILLLNGDDKLLEDIKKNRLQILKFGNNQNNDFKSSNVVNKYLEGIELTVKYLDEEMDISVDIPGEFMTYNVLAGYGCGKILGVSDDEIKKGIKEFKLSKNRMAMETSKSGIKIINDVYNANPDSMVKAIDLLKGLKTKERKGIILGDMFELGEESIEHHKKIGKYSIDSSIDKIIFVGENSFYGYEVAKQLNKNKVVYFKTQDDLIKNIEDVIKSIKIILIKGSRGMGLEKTVEKIKER